MQTQLVLLDSTTEPSDEERSPVEQAVTGVKQFKAARLLSNRTYGRRSYVTVLEIEDWLKAAKQVDMKDQVASSVKS